MGSNAADIITGVTIAFGTSSCVAEVTAFKPPGASRGWVDSTHMGTTVARTKIAKDLIEWGECEFMINFNPDTDPGVALAVSSETITVTFFGPDDAGGATWVWTGFMDDYDPQEAEVDGLMTGRVKVAVNGDVAVTPDA
jgi:hypothetical protein